MSRTSNHPNHPSAFEVYWTRRRMWIAITWSAMIAALAVAYYFFIFLPQFQRQQLDQAKSAQETQARIDQARLDLQKSEQDNQERDKADARLQLQSCLQGVQHSYTALWNQECMNRGMGPNCGLPNETVSALNQYDSEEKDGCYKQFPQA